MADMWLWTYPEFLGYAITWWLLIFLTLTIVMNWAYSMIRVSCKAKKGGICSTKNFRMVRGFFLTVTLGVSILLFTTALYVLLVGIVEGWATLTMSDMFLSVVSLMMLIPIFWLSIKKGGSLSTLQLEQIEKKGDL